MGRFNELLACLKIGSRVVIRTHDFPDHDAVGAAFGLSTLLGQLGFDCVLVYGGRLESTSLVNAVAEFAIPLVQERSFDKLPKDLCVVVDGVPGNSNVSSDADTVVAAIDHHRLPAHPNVCFLDVREHIGSCCTIIYSYFKEEGVEVDTKTAAIMLMGLLMDTSFMSRGVSREDMAAFSELFFIGDWQFSVRLLRNSLLLRDLQVFREAINACEVAGEFAFVPIQKECSAEVMAITADFFLDIQEITFVVVIVPSRNEYRLSVRSEAPSPPANAVIHLALEGIGSGGGHFHMGGGSIPYELFPGQEGVRKRFLDALTSE